MYSSDIKKYISSKRNKNIITISLCIFCILIGTIGLGIGIYTVKYHDDTDNTKITENTHNEILDDEFQNSEDIQNYAVHNGLKMDKEYTEQQQLITEQKESTYKSSDNSSTQQEQISDNTQTTTILPNQSDILKQVYNELEFVNEQAAILNEALSENYVQTELNTYSYELFLLWDDYINTLWLHLKDNMSPDDFEMLKKEQIDWITSKEEAIEEAGADVSDGSIEPMVKSLVGAELTKIRVYKLLKYLK